jgi:hypothetical protein
MIEPTSLQTLFIYLQRRRRCWGENSQTQISSIPVHVSMTLNSRIVAAGNDPTEVKYCGRNPRTTMGKNPDLIQYP